MDRMSVLGRLGLAPGMANRYDVSVKWTVITALMFMPGVAKAGDFNPDLWHRLVVTEVMVAPRGTPTLAGQWIELHNAQTEAFNLQGVVLATVRGGFHVVSPSKSLVAGPGDFLLLAPFGEGTTLPKGGVDYAYGGDFWLDPTSDILMVLKAGKLLDVFAYGPETLPVTPGASFSMEPSDGDIKEWCYGREVYDLAGNLGTPGDPNPYCDGDGDGFAEDQGDCNDHDAAVGPEAQEVCNGIDDDCNGLDDDVPLPLTGSCLDLGVCVGTEPMCAGVTGWICPYPSTYEADEVSCDGLDNDCDGQTDEDLTPPTHCLRLGVCAGTEPVCSGPAGWTCPYPDAYEEDEVSCDGLDNDCDGETDEGFDVGVPCTVGIGACARTGTRACTPDGTGARCDVEAGWPAVELCGDGVDNDCDGETDEGFPVGAKCVVGTGACRSVGKYRCAEDLLSVICSAVPGDPEAERCGDGLDNDCDGATDEEDCDAVLDGGGTCSSRPSGSGRVGGPVAWLVLLAASFAGRGRRRATSHQSGRSGTR